MEIELSPTRHALKEELDLECVPLEASVSTHVPDEGPIGSLRSGCSESSNQQDQDLTLFDLRRDGCQILPSLLMASCGLMLTGFVFEDVKQWGTFESMPEYFVMIPMLLGLKGSLDMTLASRLSTAAHLGVFENAEDTQKLVSASLALLQVQAIVCGLLTSLLGGVLHSDFEIWNALVLISSTLLTSCIAAFVFGVFTSVVVIGSSRLHMDPDNVAMPIISSLADVCTLLLLASVASGAVFVTRIGYSFVCPVVIVVILLLWLPYMWHRTCEDSSCASVAISGWPPILAQLAISQVAGIILEDSVGKYAASALLTPYINGVGGALGCVYAGRLASSLHCGRRDREVAICLTLIVFDVVLQGGFLVIVDMFNLGGVHVDGLLALVYLTASVLQVALVVAFVAFGTRLLFSYGFDPDNYMVPLLTSLGDVLGTSFLLLSLQVGGNTAVQ